MKIMTKSEFDSSGITVITGDHSYKNNVMGRRTWEDFKTGSGQYEFKTTRGLKRALTLSFQNTHEAYTGAIAVIHNSYRIINWETNERIHDGYHAVIALTQNEV